MGQNPTEPGWYDDPDGVYEHQAYWDGDRWTGETRQLPSLPAPPRSRMAVWANVCLGLGILLALVWMFVSGVIIGDLNQHLDGTEVSVVAVSEPFEGNCSDSGCMWLARYEIGLPEGPIIEQKLADPNTRIGDAYTMTYSTEGVLTFGTMNDRANELEGFATASRAIGVAALVSFGGWAILRIIDKRSNNRPRTNGTAQTT